jgi:hypothetical protein
VNVNSLPSDVRKNINDIMGYLMERFNRQHEIATAELYLEYLKFAYGMEQNPVISFPTPALPTPDVKLPWKIEPFVPGRVYVGDPPMYPTVPNTSGTNITEPWWKQVKGISVMNPDGTVMSFEEWMQQ